MFPPTKKFILASLTITKVQFSTFNYELLPTMLRKFLITTGFAESNVPLGEGCIPLAEGFTKRKLSVKASRRSCTGNGVFAESMWDPSRWTCADRPT
jgi:hypothetical protein